MTRTNPSAVYDKCAARVRAEASRGIDAALAELYAAAGDDDSAEVQHNLLLVAQRYGCVIEDAESADLPRLVASACRIQLIYDALATLLRAIDLEAEAADDE